MSIEIETAHGTPAGKTSPSEVILSNVSEVAVFLEDLRKETIAQDLPYMHIPRHMMDVFINTIRLCTPKKDSHNKTGLPTRRCMVCRRDHLKGQFKHRTDPICTSCMEDVRDQRQLLIKKYKVQYRARKQAERAATKSSKKDN
jgi:hypothetical protein